MKKNKHEFELFINHIKNMQDAEINSDRKEIINGLHKTMQ